VGDALALLAAYRPGDGPRAAASVRRTAELLQRSPAPFDRTAFDPGHVTASAVVLSPGHDHVLLVYHRRLARWLQPGGHIERGDASLAAAARREVREETGTVLPEQDTATLVSVDVHEIPPGRDEPRHLHHDFMFAVLTDAEPRHGARGDGLMWCPLDELERHGVDEPLMWGVERSLSLERERQAEEGKGQR
jgi:8-oxo-dGTP pyrophosphatase MutT (NUDIX family)